MMSLFYLQILTLLCIFLGFLFKELAGSDKYKKWRRYYVFGYWTTGCSGLIIGVFGVLLQIRQALADAQEQTGSLDATDGRNKLNDGIRNDSLVGIETSLPELRAAELALKNTKTKVNYKFAVANDLAIGTERVAYGSQSRGCLYFHNKDHIDSCWVGQGSKFYVVSQNFPYLRCTNIQDQDYWREARRRYDDLLMMIQASPKTLADNDPAIAEIATALRSIGYFRFCDYVRNGEGSIAGIKAPWVAGLMTTRAAKLVTRHNELRQKLAYLDALHAGAPPSCQLECARGDNGDLVPPQMANAKGGEFYQIALAPNSFTSVSPNVELQANTATLRCAGRTECTAKLDTVSYVRADGFDEIVVSWGGDVPPGSTLEISVRARGASDWSRYYSLGSWTADGTSTSRSQPSDGFASVDQDTLRFAKPPTELQFQVRLTTNSPGSVAKLDRLGFVTSENDVYSEIDLPVPAASQFDYEAGENWCSPTSVSMVLRYWADDLQDPAIGEDPHVIAELARDRQGANAYGNWSFNVAAVNYITKGKLSAFVTRLKGTADIEFLLSHEVPVIASVSWNAGEIPQAPIPETQGHLLVVKGITRSGDVLVNDPADRDQPSKARTYLRGAFETAWRRSHNTVYLILPASDQKLLHTLELRGIVRSASLLRAYP